MTMTNTNPKPAPIAKTEPTQVLADFLNGEAVRRRLTDVCSKSLKPDELVRLMLLAASRQPDLLNCAQHSILRALMDAAQLGIAPMGIQGRGYMVPRKNNKTGELEACFDPGWRGLCDIARRGGFVKSIDAKIVYEGDVFEYSETEQGPKLLHVPLLALPDDENNDGTGRIIAAYARAMVDGAVQLEVLRRRDIDRIAASSASQNGPWSGWFDEMARKSAVKRLCKYLPYSPDLDYAVRVADRSDRGDGDERREIVGNHRETSMLPAAPVAPARDWIKETAVIKTAIAEAAGGDLAQKKAVREMAKRFTDEAPDAHADEIKAFYIEKIAAPAGTAAATSAQATGPAGDAPPPPVADPDTTAAGHRAARAARESRESRGRVRDAYLPPSKRGEEYNGPDVPFGE